MLKQETIFYPHRLKFLISHKMEQKRMNFRGLGNYSSIYGHGSSPPTRIISFSWQPTSI